MAHKPTVAVDLDGVLAQYAKWEGIDKIGDPIPGAQRFLRALRSFADVVIHTTRTSEVAHGYPRTWEAGKHPLIRQSSWKAHLWQLVHDWLNKHEMPFDSIWTGGGKPIAAAYVDDRAVMVLPQHELGEISPYREAVWTIIHLCEIPHTEAVKMAKDLDLVYPCPFGPVDDGTDVVVDDRLTAEEQANEEEDAHPPRGETGELARPGVHSPSGQQGHPVPTQETPQTVEGVAGETVAGGGTEAVRPPGEGGPADSGEARPGPEGC